MIKNINGAPTTRIHPSYTFTVDATNIGGASVSSLASAAGSVGAKAEPLAGPFGDFKVTLVTPTGGSVKLFLQSAVTGKISAVKCVGQSCVVAAVFTSRYPNHVFSLKSSLRKKTQK
jgi:hypothetical protein